MFYTTIQESLSLKNELLKNKCKKNYIFLQNHLITYHPILNDFEMQDFDGMT